MLKEIQDLVLALGLDHLQNQEHIWINLRLKNASKWLNVNMYGYIVCNIWWPNIVEYRGNIFI